MNIFHILIDLDSGLKFHTVPLPSPQCPWAKAIDIEILYQNLGFSKLEVFNDPFLFNPLVDLLFTSIDVRY